MKEAASRGPERVPQRVLGVRIRRVKGDFVLGIAGEALLLTGPARFIYALVDGRRDVAGMADALAAEYDIDRHEAMSDVGEFLEDLTDKGAIEW
jgi:coenzyme PQQ synthesis protein D (PqqD)